ncbi:MAG: 3-hydroxybutyrate dehydrogenase [Proteobacteria bacterium]|nr:3-hydroxybutyrate dehydrogenase [Pseudomonadota bacterium]
MLNGKYALVTGSTSGIGLATARALAGEGAHIILNGFGDAKQIAKLRKDMAEEFGVKVAFSDADMSRSDHIDLMFEQLSESIPQIDILVNNVGIQHTAPIDEFPVEKWDAILAINLSSSFHTMRHVIPGMRERKWGRIINIASTHGLVASVNKSAYVAAKHGIIGLTKVAALELAESGVTCNAICPGWVRTPLVEKQIEARAKAKGMEIEEAARDLLMEKQPTGRFIKPEDIGGMAVFLTSPHAAGVTGSVYVLDGGWTAQ